MPKIGMRGVRRQQFIDAAIDVILQHGLAGISNARIAAMASLSPSLLPHYFATRALLLDAVLRKILLRCHRVSAKRLKRHSDPLTRLHILIDSHFREELFTPAMKQLCRDMHHATYQSSLLQATFSAYQTSLLSVVRHEMAQLVSGHNLDSASLGFIALLEGLWMKALHEPVLLTEKDASALQKQYLRMITTRIRVTAGGHLG